jgi:hypothetical protein
MDEPLRISCDTCVMAATSACDDCVVTFLCRREPDDAVVLDADEFRALRTLRSAGLAPPLRHQARLG